MGLTAPTGFPASATGTTLVFAPDGCGQELYAYDVDARAGRDIPLPAGYTGAQYAAWQACAFYGVSPVTGWVIFSVGPSNGAAGRYVMALPADLSAGAHQVLGPNESYERAFSALQPGAAWVVERLAGGGSQAVEVNVATGGTLATSAAFASGMDLVGEVPNGFVATVEGTDGGVGDIEVRNIETAALVRAIGVNTAPNLLEISGPIVIWQPVSGCTSCDIHLTNVVTGSDRTLAAAPGTWHCTGAALSPDGRKLAVVVGCERPVEAGSGELLLIDTSTGKTTFVSDSGGSSAQYDPVWSPDGDWVLWEGSSATTGLPVTLAHRVGSASPSTFETQVPPGLGVMFAAT